MPKKIPFDLDRALAGARLINAFGNEAKEFRKRTGGLHIIQYPYEAKIGRNCFHYTPKGKFCIGVDTVNDLYLAGD